MEESPGHGRGVFQEDLQRALPFLAAVFAHEVEVRPVGVGFGKKLGGAAESLQVQELIFDEAMDRFDVALPGVAFGGYEAVIGSEQAHGGGQAALLLVFLELASIVGLPDQAGEIDAMKSQVGGELFGHEDGVTFGEFVGVGGKAGAGDDFARCVLEAGQAVAHHLGPVVGDILQVFGVGGDLAKESPLSFDGAELFFGGGFFLARTGQPMGANDAGGRIVTDLQVKLLHETLGAEAGLLAQLDDLALQGGRSFVRAGFGGAGNFRQRRRFAGNVSAQPFANGVARSGELTRRGFNPVLASKGDDLLMKPMAVDAHAIQFKVGAVHPRMMAENFSRRCSASSGGGGAAHPFAFGSTL